METMRDSQLQVQYTQCRERQVMAGLLRSAYTETDSPLPIWDTLHRDHLLYFLVKFQRQIDTKRQRQSIAGPVDLT